MASNDKYQGKGGDAVDPKGFQNYLIRARWSLLPPRPPPQPMLARGFAGLASGAILPLPMRPKSCFGGLFPRAVWSPPEPVRQPATRVAPFVSGLAPAPPKRRRVATADPEGGPEDPDTEALEVALAAWADLVLDMGGACLLWRQMSADPSTSDATFRAAFYGKPASTLTKRASALGLYGRWAAGHQVNPWPASEEGVFRYTQFLVGERAPPTRAQSFREALGFAKGFVGLDGVDEVLASRRVAGSVLASLDRRRERRQRDVLSVGMVRDLEAFMGGEDVAEKVVIGFFLFCLHSRTRVGDALRLDREPKLDVPDEALAHGFVEAGFLRHKVSRKARSKLRLPVVADAFGVLGLPWASAWLRARAEANLDAETDGCLLPVVRGQPGNIHFCQGRSSTTDVSLLLAERLCGIDQGEEPRNLGSHSLKPTLLSWCAKYGLPLAVRRKLGGHSKGRESSVLAYSRDELAEPMRLLQGVLRAVRNGEFLPDASRSGMLVAPPAQVSSSSGAVQAFPDASQEAAVPKPQDGAESLPIASPSTPAPGSESSPDSSASSSDEPQETEEAAHLFNPRSGMFHLRHESIEGRLMCGRPVPEGMRPASLSASVACDAVRCQACYRQA